MRPPVHSKTVLLVFERNGYSFGKREPRWVVMWYLTMLGVAKEDATQSNDFGASWGRRMRDLARSHGKEIGHDCVFCNDRSGCVACDGYTCS